MFCNRAKWASVALWHWLNHGPQFVLKHSDEGLCSWRTVFKGMLPQKHENIPWNGYILIGRLPLWLKDKESACRCRRCRFDPWIRKDTLEKEMATHSSIPAWEIPWTESVTGYSPGGRMTWRLSNKSNGKAQLHPLAAQIAFTSKALNRETNTLVYESVQDASIGLKLEFKEWWCECVFPNKELQTSVWALMLESGRPAVCIPWAAGITWTLGCWILYWAPWLHISSPPQAG